MKRLKYCIMCTCLLETADEFASMICVRCKPGGAKKPKAGAVSQAGTQAPPAPAKPAAPKRILVIDDEPILVKLLKMRLESEGYVVLTAGDGKEGYQKILSEKPDLVLSDILMPGLTGYDIIQKIKKEKSEIAHTPIIIMTAKASMEDFFSDWEIHGFMKKPIAPDELLRKIRELMALADKRRGR